VHHETVAVREPVSEPVASLRSAWKALELSSGGAVAPPVVLEGLAAELWARNARQRPMTAWKLAAPVVGRPRGLLLLRLGLLCVVPPPFAPGALFDAVKAVGEDEP
jgi:hypothetical protein